MLIEKERKAYGEQYLVESTPNNPAEARAVPSGNSGAASHFAKLSLLWHQRRFIFWMSVWGFVCCAILSLLIPVRYESTARLMPPDSSSDSYAMLSAVADKAGALGGLAGNILGGKSSGDLLVGILTSNTLRDRLVARYDLKKVYGIAYDEDVRIRLSDNTAIGVDRKSGIIAITVTDRDAKRAAALANAYVDELNLLSAELSTSSARRERIFLEDRLKQVDQDLEHAEKDLSQFSSKNATFNPVEQGKAMIEGVAMLQGRLIAAQAELDGLRTIYADTSPRIRALRAEVGTLHQEIEKMGGKPGTEPSADTTNELYPSLRQLPLRGVPYADLFRRAKIEEAIFETLTRQYELAKVQEAKEIPTVRVLDRGEVPQKKSFPPRTVITLMGAFLAFGFAILWTLGSAMWEAADPASPGRLLGVQVWDNIASPIRGLSQRIALRRAAPKKETES